MLSTGESVLFSGRDDNLHHHGVALMISKEAEKSLLEWKPINDRIVHARFFSRFVKLSVIQVYAPTNEANEEDKDNFYDQLQLVLDSVHKHDMLIVMGDLNAKVGDDNEECENKHGIGVRNDNGERLVDFCGLNNLVVTGTIFPHRRIHKETWVSPDGQTKNQIDHVLVSRQHRTSVRDTRLMRGADIASDYQLVRTKIKLKLKRKQQTKANRRKFDTIKLQQPAIRLQFSIKLKNRFDVLQEYEEDEELEDNAEKRWQEFENAYKETSEETLGYKQKGQKPWINKKSLELEEERRKLKNVIEQTKSDRIKQNLKDDYKRMDKEVKKSMRRDKRRWAENLATEAEEAAGNGRMKELYEITKTLSHEKREAINTVKDKHGNLLTEDSARKDRMMA